VSFHIKQREIKDKQNDQLSVGMANIERKKMIMLNTGTITRRSVQADQDDIVVDWSTDYKRIMLIVVVVVVIFVERAYMKQPRTLTERLFHRNAE
jgi:hypothetical protein